MPPQVDSDGSSGLPVRWALSAWRAWRRGLPSDLREDCVQEAEIAALRASGRFGQLPESDRVRYLAASVRRAVRAFVARELAYQRVCRPSPSLSTAQQLHFGVASQEATKMPSGGSICLVDVV